ncbi:MAG: carbohydrate ABC transporter permease [Pseudonocardiaceae bacterium]
MTVTTRTGDAGAPTSSPPATGNVRKRSGAGEVGVNVFSHTVLIAWSVMVLVPFAWALLASVKTSREIFGSPWALPEVIQWSNFARAWDKGVREYLLNSIVVVTGGVLLTMLFGSMVAYVLARYEFRGNRFIYYLFAAGMMFPVFLAIVPLFFVVRNLGMLSTYQGLILVYVAYSLPFTVFFMHSFFRTLPTSIAEAAFMDGCSHTGVFFRVMLPMAKPGLLSIGIFNVLGQFNQFVLPQFLSPEKPVLAQGIATLLASQRYEGDWGALFAALTIAMAPVVVVYLIFYRQVQAGLTSGTLK